MRALLLSMACGVCFLSAGCAMFEEGRHAAQNTLKVRDRDYRDDNNFADEYHDENDSVQQLARGDQPMDHESDRLTNLWTSPKARAIERNLNYD